MMKLFEKPWPVCPTNQHCSQWARIYMKYCLCSVKDEVSLTLGLVSVISWGVAEVPQIITNFRKKSTEGLSIAFLMTWVVGKQSPLNCRKASHPQSVMKKRMVPSEVGDFHPLEFLDLFNLFGCKLESDTLPTQYYTAFLYTVTTMVLLGQTIYYGHIYQQLKIHRVNEAEGGFTNKKNDGNVGGQQCNSDNSEMNTSCVVEEGRLHTSSPIAVASKANCILSTEKDLYYMVRVNEAEGGFTNKKNDGNVGGQQCNSDNSEMNTSCVVEEGRLHTSSPIAVASKANCILSTEKDLYYMSARSLSRSHTPTAGSYPAHIWSRRTPSVEVNDQQSLEEPFLGNDTDLHSAPPSNTKSLLCVASAMICFIGGFNLHLSPSDRSSLVLGEHHGGLIIQVRRTLLQSSGVSQMLVASGGSSVGTSLGWAMAAIYMGGRLPQICLNVKRGHVEGLNPLMFIFALVGNLTYVASILVSSLDWCKIKSNLPWLVDAAGCVILDSFVGSFMMATLTLQLQNSVRGDMAGVLQNPERDDMAGFNYFRWRKSRGSNGAHGHFVAA